ncbi:hypothetical protein [Microbacterium sp. 77mftsu3.1]|uniref:hypothetical protein n=1 Tax=Microbacterium sp. 77mftsu3.1 TaxID=1761802 RepID=UPI000363A84F|nr:hypothetical protein [Microbacterium sp. 77mftsu3.1]SDH49949.1 hypothetical protein SAMN04488590_3454 [Microbacterium sp. 77mftsu3.1]
MDEQQRLRNIAEHRDRVSGWFGTHGRSAPEVTLGARRAEPGDPSASVQQAKERARDRDPKLWDARRAYVAEPAVPAVGRLDLFSTAASRARRAQKHRAAAAVSDFGNRELAERRMLAWTDGFDDEKDLARTLRRLRKDPGAMDTLVGYLRSATFRNSPHHPEGVNENVETTITEFFGDREALAGEIRMGKVTAVDYMAMVDRSVSIAQRPIDERQQFDIWAREVEAQKYRYPGTARPGL